MSRSRGADHSLCGVIVFGSRVTLYQPRAIGCGPTTCPVKPSSSLALPISLSARIRTRSPGARTSATGTINAIYSCKNFCLQCSQQAITLFVVFHKLARELEAFLQELLQRLSYMPTSTAAAYTSHVKTPSDSADEPGLPGVPPIHGQRLD